MAKKRKVGTVKIFPAKHYIIDEDAKNDALSSIQRELEAWVPSLPGDLEKQRLTSRTNYDLEMIQELGYCSGIENYSRHLDGRKPGQPPFCLLDFFGSNFLLVIDESHVLDRLVNLGNTVVLIEHNLDVIAASDWIIDLGPEGGDNGGSIVVTGTPDHVSNEVASHTGKYLKSKLLVSQTIRKNKSGVRS